MFQDHMEGASETWKYKLYSKLVHLFFSSLSFVRLLNTLVRPWTIWISLLACTLPPLPKTSSTDEGHVDDENTKLDVVFMITYLIEFRPSAVVIHDHQHNAFVVNTNVKKIINTTATSTQTWSNNIFSETMWNICLTYTEFDAYLFNLNLFV